MNQRSRIIVIAAVLIAISPGTSLAQAEVTDYTLRSWQNVTGQPFPLGDDACAVLGLPDGCIAPFTGGYMELGELRCLKGTPTGNPMQPCSKPSPVHVRNSRGWVTAAMTFSTEPGDPVTAFLIFTTNANWDADYTGPAWGEMSAVFCDGDDDMPSFNGAEWTFCPASGIIAVAEGIWNGLREHNTSAYPGSFVGHLRWVLHGTEGLARGALMKGDMDFYTFLPLPLIAYGIGDGTILFPPRNGHAK